MPVKIIDAASVMEEKRSRTIKQTVPFEIKGRIETVEKSIVNGEMEVIEFDRPIGEMLTNEQTQKEFMAKVTLDVEMGREQVPILYKPVYATLTDANFPEVFDAKWALTGRVVFLEHIEGEEVKFGSLVAEQGPIARIKTFTTGVEYTEEIQRYNQAFNLELINQAIGEAHNALLNHIHLGPIILHSYPQANITQPVYVNGGGEVQDTKAGSNARLSIRATIKQGLTDSRTFKRPGTILIANSVDREDILDAMGRMTINATDYEAVTGIDTIIFYDGWETTVGKKDYSYPGVPAGKLFLVRPKRGFKELIKQELRIRANNGDLSRLVEAQIVADVWRGVFAAVEENVQQIIMP